MPLQLLLFFSGTLYHPTLKAPHSLVYIVVPVLNCHIHNYSDIGNVILRCHFVVFIYLIYYVYVILFELSVAKVLLILLHFITFCPMSQNHIYSNLNSEIKRHQHNIKTCLMILIFSSEFCPPLYCSDLSLTYICFSFFITWHNGTNQCGWFYFSLQFMKLAFQSKYHNKGTVLCQITVLFHVLLNWPTSRPRQCRYK